MIVTRGHILGYFYPPALLAMFSVFSNFYGWRSESSNLRIKPCPTHAESRRKDVFDLNLEQSLIRILFSISKSYYFVGRKLLLFDGRQGDSSVIGICFSVCSLAAGWYQLTAETDLTTDKQCSPVPQRTPVMDGYWGRK